MSPLSFNMSLASAFLLIWVIIHFPFSTACLKSERNYLLDFKGGLNLSSGRSLSSWRGFNCCEWEGVGCDYHTSHVIRLDLSSRPYDGSDDWLSGELRSSLFDLQHLQHLDLSWNDFQCISIPFKLSKLQKLTFLSLSYAGFCGDVPLELGNMSSLCHLDISGNYEMRSSKFDVWVRNLRSLQFLGMQFVNLELASEHWGEALSLLPNLTEVHLLQSGLSGKIPDLSNLTHLTSLHIGGNSFPFDLPSWFENVSSLVSLDLFSCGLKGSIPSNFLARSRMSNFVLSFNHDLKGKLSFILSHSSSLVYLSLYYCSLGGAFPHSLTNFSKLKTMDLSHNNLQGTIPSYFGSFSSLRYLELSYNQLSGHIPLSLLQLPKLRRLNLDHNQLSRTIPDSISHLPKLRRLNLDHNQLSGTIPNSISHLASLEMLFLSSNRLTDKFSLQLLENVTRLQWLDLSENQLLVDISTSWVPQFSHLQLLALGSCNIEGDLPLFLSQQYQLQLIDLSDNNIVGNLPSWLWDLPQLVWLNLSNNQLEGCLPPKISNNFTMVDLHGNRLYGSLPALDFVSSILDLSDNEFNGSIPARLGIVQSLSLSRNNLTGQIPSSICVSPYSLTVLDLSKNKLIGVIPANIGRCSYNLLVLKLAQNVLQGTIPEELGNLTGLYTLNLNGNKLQGIISSSISNCRDLQVFDLGNNKFEGTIPIWIENLTDLRILKLGSNKVVDRIPCQLFRMQNLQILDLSGNQLSGSIPPDVTRLHALLNSSQSFDVQHLGGECDASYEGSNCGFYFADEVTVWIKARETTYEKIISADKFMDLSHNKLSGNIPSELGLLKGLISLNISKNGLSGSIPESLGAMAYLESLDVSKNKLSGKIPSQLLNLTFLAVLNLSDNMLFGLIPQGKQFSTFEASSFLGNPKLYGPQLENMTRSSSLGSKNNPNNTIVIDRDGGRDADVMDQWWAVGVGLSYGVGFATMIAVLCFHLKWRYTCFAYMDNFIYYLLE